MKLLEILKPVGIEPFLKGSDKLAVLQELSEVAARVDERIDPAELTDILLARERLGTTGIGHGVAIPHGKTRSLEELVVVFGRSQHDIDFEARDDKPCRLFFLLAAPLTSGAGHHLKALARISRLLQSEEFRNHLLEAPDADSLWDTIRHEDERI